MGEAAVPRVPATHIDMRWIVAGGNVIGQVVNLPRLLPTALFSLPQPPAQLAGRVEELEALLAELAPTTDDGTDAGSSPVGDASSAVVLAGMGGVGKTALALAAGAIAHHKGWFCAELYVDLRGYTPGAQALTIEAALDVLLRQMGVDPADIPLAAAERAAFYRSALAGVSRADERNRPVLVVADNARSAAQIRRLLPGAGGHRLVATSRNKLRSLIGARHMDLEVLKADAARALLSFALTAAGPQDARADDEAGLGRLAGVCGYLPLALEITAAQLAHDEELTPEELATQLERAASLVDEVTDPDPVADQALVLRAVFDTSLKHLTPEHVRVFLLVASAPGPSTSTEAAAALTGLSPDKVHKVLVALASAHLLTRPAPGRWGAHDLLTDHATTHPHPPQDRTQAMDRLLNHYTDTAHAAHTHLRAPHQAQTPDLFSDREAILSWLDTEWPTLVAAALAAPTLGHAKGAILLPLFLGQYLAGKRLLEEGEQVSRSAQRAAHAIGDQNSEATAWNSLGILLQEMGRFEEAIDAHTNARDLNQQNHNLQGEATAWNNLGNALQGADRFEKAVDAHTRALRLHQQVNNAPGEAAAWDNLGSALSELGRFDEAIDAHTRARTIHHRLGNLRGQARTWGNLGNTLRKAGRVEEMSEAYTRACDLHRQAEDDHGEAKAWKNLGFVLLTSGREEQAVKAFTKALVLFEAAGDDGRAASVRDLIVQIQEGSNSEESV